MDELPLKLCPNWQDPRCAKVTIAGEIMKVPDNELEIAKELMFRRHRQMANWHTHKFTL